MFKIKALPAYDGDCFIISFGEKENIKNIIIDGGRRLIVVGKLIEEINEIIDKGQRIDLMILTHIDNDHISGLLKLFEEPWINKEIINEVWFNSKGLIGQLLFEDETEDESLRVSVKGNSNISFRQGITFEERLKNLHLGCEKLIFAGYSEKIGDANIKVLSPNKDDLLKLYTKWSEYITDIKPKDHNISAKSTSDYKLSISELLEKPYEEDDALVNSTSIAIEIDYKNKKILLLGDALPSVIVENLKEIYGEEVKKINYDLIKLSHHGSKRNINEDFVNIITSDKYLISTNGLTHGLPNKETLVKIVSNRKEKTTVYFNYPKIIEKMFTKEEIDTLKVEFKEGKNNEVLEVALWNCSES